MKNPQFPQVFARVPALRPTAAATVAAVLALLAALAANHPAKAQTAAAPAPQTVDRVVPEQSAAATGASADPSEAALDEEQLTEAVAAPRWQVGDDTRRLLALQRGGDLASPVARPVPGEVAQRSRERYLKSFEREIPEYFRSSVGGSKQGSGGN